MIPKTLAILSSALLVAAGLVGCRWRGRSDPAEPAPASAAPEAGPLLAEQRRAYPELAGGRVNCLADFEDEAAAREPNAAPHPAGDANIPAVGAGRRQVDSFHVVPLSSEAARKLDRRIARTGAAAMEVTLPAGAELVFDLPETADIRPYKLLSVAVYSRAFRDDLRLSLDSEAGTWQGPRVLVEPGWNTVLADIRGPAGADGAAFDPARVRRVRLSFTDAAGPVWFHIDDVMLIDNARRITPAPAGLELRRSGLEYTLRGPAFSAPLRLAAGEDGLARMTGVGAQVRLAGVGEELPTVGEKLDVLGGRRVGLVALAEHNAMRVRFACTWFFARRAGQWVSLPARRITWGYTIYGDGRCVVQGELNNAGGREIFAAAVAAPREAAFYGRSIGRVIELHDFAGEVGRWQYLIPPADRAGRRLAENYLHPGSVRLTLGEADALADGDYDRDGFDESQGCYVLGSRGGQCRFVLDPPEGGLTEPVLLLTSTRPGDLCVNSEGLAIRSAVRRADGSVLVRLPGRTAEATAVEASGL